MKKTKYTLLALAFSVMSLVVFAQSDTAQIWRNASYVTKSGQQQFTDFNTNKSIYPARPKDMWEIGATVGATTMSGDLRNDIGVGYLLSARKALSHVWSLRPYGSFYSITGNANNYPGAADFRTRSWGLGVDAIASLNTLHSYRGNPKFNIYLLGGFGMYFNSIHKLDPVSGKYYQWYDYPTWNTVGNMGNSGPNGQKHLFLVPTFNIGGGMVWKINDRFNLGIESRNSLTNYDYLDGYSSQFSNAFDAYWFTGVRLNYNIGDKAKRVQPLWWINPKNYVYNELNNPKQMLPNLKVKARDADGDGIIDDLDLEPNTPAGVSVDAHGRALDSDGDGIPDYKDKELLTRQECFPVNADGVGTCPESACCKESKEKIEKLQKTIEEIRTSGGGNMGAGNCGINNLPSIAFGAGSAKLSRDNMRLLDAVAQQMKNNPSCNLKVVGHPEASKASQQKAYDRVESIIKYLVDKQGVNEGRFIFAYDGGSGDGNTIDLQGTSETGPNTVPAPAPHLKNKN